MVMGITSATGDGRELVVMGDEGAGVLGAGTTTGDGHRG